MNTAWASPSPAKDAVTSLWLSLKPKQSKLCGCLHAKLAFGSGSEELQKGKAAYIKEKWNSKSLFSLNI